MSWILGEKIYVLGVGFIVTVILARQLGPENFGVLSYAISLTSIFAITGHMGLAGLVVRELVKNRDQSHITLGSAGLLKGLGMFSGYLLLLAYVMLFEESQSIEFFAIIVIGGTIIFGSSQIFNSWFESRVQAKYISISSALSFSVGAMLKLVFVCFGLGVVWISTAYLIQSILLFLFLIFFYCLKADLSLLLWTVRLTKVRFFLIKGLPVFLSAVFAMIYLKVDQVMLRWMVGVEEVGVYAVASRISEVWYFVPTAIVASIFPRLIEIHSQDIDRFNKRLQQVVDLLFVLAVCVAISVAIVAEPIIGFFFGDAYSDASIILAVHIWAAVFIFMRAALSKWILINELFTFSLVTQASGALFNLIMNFLLIPSFGGKGAAIATLLSYSMASYFVLVFYKPSRVMFWMMTRSFFLPVRILCAARLNPRRSHSG